VRLRKKGLIARRDGPDGELHRALVSWECCARYAITTLAELYFQGDAARLAAFILAEGVSQDSDHVLPPEPDAAETCRQLACALEELRGGPHAELHQEAAAALRWLIDRAGFKP